MKRLFSPAAFRLVGLLLLAAIIALVAYGRLAFPDAPIRPCVEGYCGRSGTLYPQQAYQCYKLWDKALLVCWIAAAGCWLAAWVWKKLTRG